VSTRQSYDSNPGGQRALAPAALANRSTPTLCDVFPDENWKQSDIVGENGWNATSLRYHIALMRHISLTATPSLTVRFNWAERDPQLICQSYLSSFNIFI
jgi:hypothetical protein